MWPSQAEQNLWSRRCHHMHVSTNKHTHTHTAFWCLSASSMCWVGLSDFWRLVKCNHSYLPYSAITARTNGMLTVQRHGAIVFILYVSMFVCTCCAPTSAYYVESGLINEWRDGFECPSSGRSCVKAAICVFSVCLTMHARKGMLTGLCVCVCSPVSLAISSLSLLQWRFSLQITRKVEMGLSQQPQLRVENSSQLITVTRSSQGCI